MCAGPGRLTAVLLLSRSVDQELHAVMTGDDVTIVQNLLARQRSAAVYMTGQFDPQTAQATRVFQEANKLPVTGAVDAATASGICGQQCKL